MINGLGMKIPAIPLKFGREQNCVSVIERFGRPTPTALRATHRTVCALDMVEANVAFASPFSERG
jgi:hypothetical protein